MQAPPSRVPSLPTSLCPAAHVQGSSRRLGQAEKCRVEFSPGINLYLKRISGGRVPEEKPTGEQPSVQGRAQPGLKTSGCTNVCDLRRLTGPLSVLVSSSEGC